MPFSSGTFTLYSPGNPVVTQTTISSSWANNTLTDIATALSACLLKDGTQTITANIPMSGFRLTGLGAATALTDAIQATQVQNHSISQLTTVSGSDTVIGTATPTPSAYAIGQVFEWIQATTNTGAATLNVSTIGAASLRKNSPGGLVPLVGGDLVAGAHYFARYDTATPAFVVLNPEIRDVPATGLSAAGTIQSNATLITARVNVISTVASGTGVILTSISGAGYSQTVYNAGANPLSIYPPTGASINGLAANAKMVLAVKSAVRLECISSTQWVGILSA
jgi:hypothetical protein